MSEQPAVIITGASRGIGAWTARWLCNAGARVCISARSKNNLKKLEEELVDAKGDCISVAADVSDAEACSLLVKKTLEKYGTIDALINNAGVLSPIAKIADCEPEQFRRNIMVNLLGPFLLIHESVQFLRESRGRVINVSSGAATNPIPTWSAYCAAKAGLTHFAKVLAAEEPSITTVSVRPGVVDTDMQALIREEGVKTMPSKLSEYFVGLKEKGGLVPPQTPARSIAWLALKAPAELTGKFVEYDDPRITDPAVKLFGDQV